MLNLDAGIVREMSHFSSWWHIYVEIQLVEILDCTGVRLDGLNMDAGMVLMNTKTHGATLGALLELWTLFPNSGIQPWIAGTGRVRAWIPVAPGMVMIHLLKAAHAMYRGSDLWMIAHLHHFTRIGEIGPKAWKHSSKLWSTLGNSLWSG